MRLRPSWIIWYAVLLHALWASLLLINEAPLGATALHVYTGVPTYLLAGLFFAAAGLAAVALMRDRPTWKSLALLLPQQGLLSISAFGALLAVIYARYGDGAPRPRLFILADQAPVILTMLLHTAAVIELHARRPREDVVRTAFAAMNNEAERLREALAEKAAALRRLDGRSRRP